MMTSKEEIRKMFKIGKKYVKDLVPNYTYVNPYPTVWGWGMDGHPRILQYKHYLILPPSTNHISSYNNVYFPRYKLEKIWDTKKKRNADTCGSGGGIPWHLGGRSKK